MPKLYPQEIKNEAIKLRQQGFSYTEIIQRLIEYQIPKNTLTGWFKSIVLSETAKQRIIERIRIGGSPGRAAAWQNIHNKRLQLLDDIYNKAKSEIITIDQLASKLCLAMLYLAEGYKAGEMVRFGNSDYKVIQIFLSLLRKNYIIDESKMRGKVQCRADQNVSDLEKYWSKISNIPINQFQKPQIDKRTRGKPTKKVDYKGVFVVEYCSNALFLELKFISDIIHTLLTNGPVVYR